MSYTVAVFFLISFSQKSYGQSPDQWASWNQSISNAFLDGVAVYPHSAEDRFHDMCSKLYQRRIEHVNSCIGHNLDTLKNQRGKENGIFISMNAVDGCHEVVVSSAAGDKTIVYYDAKDTAEQIVQDISVLFNITAQSDSYTILLNHLRNGIANIPSHLQNIECAAASSRREFSEWELSVLSTERMADAVETSSYNCEYPFLKMEWLLPEMNAMIPLGSCLFNNLYIHNNNWYFVSDTLSDAEMPFIRLNTRSVENRGLDYELKPKVISKTKLSELKKYSVRDNNYQDSKYFDGVLAVVHRLTRGNHGHALFDVALPILWTTRLHNLSTDNLMVLFADLDKPDAVDDRLKIVSERRAPVYRRHQLLGLLCRPGVWCRYGKVLAGIGGFGIEYYPSQSNDRYELYRNFRKRAAMVFNYKYLEINYDFNSCRGLCLPAISSILIVQRYGNRAFSLPSISFMVDFFETMFPEAHVMVQYFDMLSVIDQAKLMQNISIMVAVDGTALDNALFMPPCTGIVVVGRDVLNSEQYILNDGFEMHIDHINLWNQWLSVVMFESPPGSWSDSRGKGPLGSLAWNQDSKRHFLEAIDLVVQRRLACAAARGYSLSQDKLVPVKVGLDNEFRSLSKDNFPRPLLFSRRVMTPSDFGISSDIVARVELTGQNNWYEIHDFWNFEVTSSVELIAEMQSILQPHLSSLVYDKNVFVINSGDGFVPIVSFFGRCKTLEVLEGRFPDNVAALLNLFNVLFKNIKVFFQHLLRVDIYNDPASFLQRDDIDTLFVMSGMLDDTIPCEAKPCPLASFVPLLAQRTREHLVIEYISENSPCNFGSAPINGTNGDSNNEVEDMLRRNFMSFFLAGYIRSTCSFLYVASGPVDKVKETILRDSIQGIILAPQNGSSIALSSNGNILQVSVVVSGPVKALHSMKLMNRTLAAEHENREQLDDFISPRLLVDREGAASRSGCYLNDGRDCFGKYHSTDIGDLKFLTYETKISVPGIYFITFQILENAKRVYKAHFTPNIVSQHSVRISVSI